ncbi:MAG: hypothetical protein ACO1OB_04375 [Archangium sp.]
MEKTVGPEKWAEFLKARTARFTFLQSPVMPISRIEVKDFLTLHDELVDHFFDGDKQAYWRFGEQSAEWALQHQLRGLFSPGEGRRFLQFAPQIFRNYFDGGELLSELGPTHTDLVIRGVEIPHVYFEYSVIGFAAGGLRALEVNAKPECIEGFSRGDDAVRYRFAVTR